MRAVLEAGCALAREAQVRLVDECGRLERVAVPLPAHVAMGQAPQLLIDEPGELLEGKRVALAPRGQQSGHFPGAARLVLHSHRPGTFAGPDDRFRPDSSFVRVRTLRKQSQLNIEVRKRG